MSRPVRAKRQTPPAIPGAIHSGPPTLASCSPRSFANLAGSDPVGTVAWENGIAAEPQLRSPVSTATNVPTGPEPNSPDGMRTVPVGLYHPGSARRTLPRWSVPWRRIDGREQACPPPASGGNCHGRRGLPFESHRSTRQLTLKTPPPRWVWTCQLVSGTGYGGNPINRRQGHSAGGYPRAWASGLGQTMARRARDRRQHPRGVWSRSADKPSPISSIRTQRGIPDTRPVIDEYAPVYHVCPDAPPLLSSAAIVSSELLGRYEESATSGG